MNHFSFDQISQFVMALLAAVSAFIAAWKSHQTGRKVDTVQAVQAAHIANAVPGAEAPGVSLNDAFRYWDLISKVKSAWGAVRGQPSGVMGSLPEIKGVKIDGRRADIGPTPIVFRE